MDAAYRMLGQRIVKAARLAVAVDLHSSLAYVDPRQVVIGGAGPVVRKDGDLVTDDVVPPPAARDRHSRSAPIADAGGAE